MAAGHPQRRGRQQTQGQQPLIWGSCSAAFAMWNMVQCHHFLNRSESLAFSVKLLVFKTHYKSVLWPSPHCCLCLWVVHICSLANPWLEGRRRGVWLEVARAGIGTSVILSIIKIKLKNKNVKNKHKTLCEPNETHIQKRFIGL